MRRNFAQIIANTSINIAKEYDRLTGALYYKPVEPYSNQTLYNKINECFSYFSFRGTCFTLEEFDEQYEFNFPEYITNEDIDTFVSFCEYFYNLLTEFNEVTNPSEYNNLPIVELYWSQIDKVMDAIGYMRSEMNGLTIYVERSAPAIAVAESPLIPQDLSYKIIAYNHYSMRGNLPDKKNTILQLADLLEPRRKDLAKADNTFTSDLNFLFNKLNIRHNNIDPSGKNYVKVVAEMPPDQLEEWYDETYQMCLLAFMQLEHIERKVKFDELKKQIEGS